MHAVWKIEGFASRVSVYLRKCVQNYKNLWRRKRKIAFPSLSGNENFAIRWYHYTAFYTFSIYRRSRIIAKHEIARFIRSKKRRDLTADCGKNNINFWTKFKVSEGCIDDVLFHELQTFSSHTCAWEENEEFKSGKAMLIRAWYQTTVTFFKLDELWIS